MKESVAVSFIISYYNLDCYLLERTIHSILNISNGIDYEIIVIDDGTKDSRAEECVLTFNNDKIIYYYQQNGGLSAARNAGIQLASKEYIQFVDADDYLFKDGYTECLKILSSVHPDLLQFSLKRVWGKESVLESKFVDNKFKIWDGVQFMVHHTLSCAACGYCFRKAILGDVRFVKGIYQEDEEFSPRLFLKAKTFVKTQIQAYAYYQRENSITGSTEFTHIEKRFADLKIVIKSMIRNRESASDKFVKIALSRRVDQLALAYIYNALELGPNFNYVTDKLDDMKAIGLYPLPFKNYSFRYVTFNLLSRNKLLLRLMRIFIKR